MWLSWLSTVLQSEGSPVQFPVRTHAWVVDSFPSWGAREGQPTDTSLSHQSFSLPSPHASPPKLFLKNPIESDLKNFHLVVEKGTHLCPFSLQFRSWATVPKCYGISILKCHIKKKSLRFSILSLGVSNANMCSLNKYLLHTSYISCPDLGPGNVTINKAQHCCLNTE